MGGTSFFAIVFVYPAGEAGISPLSLVIADIQRGAAVSALHQSRKGLYLAGAVFSAPSLHHLMHRIPQVLSDERFVCVLRHDPLRFICRNAVLIKEALGLCASEYDLAKVYGIVQNCPHRSSVPVKGLSPVVAVFIVVRVILVEVRLRVKDLLPTQNLCHTYITDTVGKHLENAFDHLSRFGINNQVMSIIRVFLVTERRAAANEHSTACPRPVCCFCFGGSLPRIE